MSKSRIDPNDARAGHRGEGVPARDSARGGARRAVGLPDAGGLPDAAAVRELSLRHVRVTPRTVWSFVAVTLDDGRTGWGEATWSTAPDTLDAPAAAAARALAGRPLAAAESFAASRGILPMHESAVASAIEQACWDLRGQLAGCSAARLRGEPRRTRVRLYANINRRTVDRSPAGFVRSARIAIDAGFNALKVAPFDGLTPELCRSDQGRQLMDAGLARVAAVREAMGPGVDVFVDCHWRFDRGLAAAALRELAQAGVTWFECPLPEVPEHMDALRALRSEANARGVRTAGLEELTHPEAFRPWLAAGCYDVVMPDVKYAGGIGGVLRVGDLAAAHGTACAPHNPTGPICHAASLAACAMGAGMDLLEHQFDETPAFQALVDDALPHPRDGHCAVPEGPGLGVRLRPDRWPV